MAYLLAQLLVESAKVNPEQIAIIDAQRQVNYRELNELSDHFAHHLLQSGVSYGDHVGIYLNKSLEAVAAIFGVLKIGAVYVPLDMTAPKQRIAYIIDDCQIKVLICSSKKIPIFQNICPRLILTDEILDNTTSIYPLPEQSITANDLAYILYTSGSTGLPKGVIISHRAALSFIDWASETFAIKSSDRISSHAPFHFDLSIFDIFVTLKVGATMVLVPPAFSAFPRALADFITKQAITVWYSVPSVLIQLVLKGQLAEKNLSTVRLILFAGEVFPIKYLRQLMTQMPQAHYHNLYGPTETNVCTHYPVLSTDIERTEAVPIGKACPHCQLLVLDKNDQQVAVGKIGELCVFGASVMNGYWQLPERTAQTLIPYTIDKQKEPVLIYRTGDLVRQADDGNYIYIGRCDNQIKSRGYRIELGEIEAILYKHPAVEVVAVVAVADDEIGNLIRAVVVVNDKTMTQDRLNDFCAQQLPKYMLPHAIEFRAVLPKTSSGKIDKTQLR